MLCLDLDTLTTETGLATIAHGVKYGNDHPHREWHRNTFCANVMLAKKGHSVDLIKAGQDPPLWYAKALRHKKSIQKKVLKIYELERIPHTKSKLHKQLRARLDRLEIDVPSGHRVTRALKRLHSLKGKVKPSIMSVYIKTLLNGWPTSRRMRFMHNDLRVSKCPFCNKAQDSIEHFAYCLSLIHI